MMRMMRMDSLQRTTYQCALTFSAIEGRAMTDVESRFVERMRSQYPEQCARLDASVRRDLEKRQQLAAS